MIGFSFRRFRRVAAAVVMSSVFAACAGGGATRPVPQQAPSAAGPLGQFAVPAAPSFAVPPRPQAATPLMPATSRRLRPSSAHPSFFAGEAALNNGVYYLALPDTNVFGYYSYLTNQSYIYHFDLGYEYILDANDGAGGLYMYDFASSHWWYTNRAAFPYVYDFSLNTFLYYYPDTNNAGHYTTNPRYFYDFGTQEIITLPSPATSTKSFTVSPSGPSSATFDAITNGIGGNITMPAASASATLTATLSTTPPNGVPTVSDTLRRPASIGGSLTPIAYISVTSSASVTFAFTPGVTASPFGTVPAYGYLGAYDPTNGWVAAAGATTLVGSHFTFAPLNALYTITPGTPYVFAIFASASLVAVTPPGNTDTPDPGGIACSSYAVWANGRGRLPHAVARQSTVVSNRLYVTRRADARTTSAVHGMSLRSVPLGSESNGLVHEAITLPAGTDAVKAAAQLRSTAGVVDVAPVHRRFLEGDGAANDPLLDNDHQWYLTITNVDPGAWAITHGTGITVAMIDTGVDETNADLAPKLNKTESIVGGIVTTSAQDTNGHGSNTAGLAAASTNNGYGFASTGWDVHLLAYKIFPDTTNTSDCQGADTADEAAAIYDAVANGVSVISLSIGSPQSSGADAAEQTAVESAISSGVTVVAADGNEGPGAPPDYPAAYAGVIAVGASSVTDSTANTYSAITSENVASYSNDSPTLVAPGGDALADDPNLPPDYLHWIAGYGTTTANATFDRCSNSGGVCEVLFNGTSQATPQVSGAVALMMAKHGGGRSLTPAQVKSILTSTAHLLPSISATRQGAGRLNVQAAVAGS
jgi:Subtilase family